jgi:hypothetical protein
MALSKITKADDITLSGGVYLGGTGSANYLDDYEEGTWTMVAGGSGGQSGQSYAAQTGRYTKIGRLVNVCGYFQVSNIGTVSGTYAQVQGLPFSAGSGTSANASGAFGYFTGIGTSNAGMFLYVPNGSSVAYVTYRSSFGTSSLYLSPSGWGSSPQFMFSLTYTTDA